MNIIERVHKTIIDGGRLTDEQALALFNSNDVLAIAELAQLANQKVNSQYVFYNINRHINPTNICVKTCKFCAFSRKPHEQGAYAYSLEEILAKAQEVAHQGATEIHMVGGLHPRWSFSHFLEIIAAIKTNFPQLHIKAFTAVELDWLAQVDRRSVKEILVDLKGAGLGSLPGGGAEIFHPEIREKICDTKTTAERWLEIHRTAHQLGLKSNCTMLYGHIESYRHRVDHLHRLRQLQDQTQGFNCFIPLAFQPYDNDMGIKHYTVGIDDLKTIAIARLYLDNIKNIKAYWIMLGKDIAQLALAFGANDLDGTVTEEKISHMAGGRSGMAMNRKQIEVLIEKAERIAIERDTLYKPLVILSGSEESRRDPSVPLRMTFDKLNIVEQLLYKAEKREQLLFDEALLLAKHAPLIELGQCAEIIKSKFLSPQCVSLAIKLPSPSLDVSPSSCQMQEQNIKFANLNFSLEHFNADKDQFSFNDLIAIIKECHGNKNLELSISGIKGLWQLSRCAKISLQDAFCQLKSSGISILESSLDESEDDLTSLEIIETHRAAHLAQIFSIAKLELSAAVDGRSEAFWDKFIKRLLEFTDLQRETHSLLAFSIDRSPHSRITPCEYLRAIALTRILGQNVTHIIAPFGKIPLVGGSSRQSSLTVDNPELKLIALCIYFGATDLGAIDISKYQVKTITEELYRSGLKHNFRDQQFNEIPDQLI